MVENKRTFFMYQNKKKLRHEWSGEQSAQGIEPWKLYVPEEETYWCKVKGTWW
jgi:hypothetical protein